MLSRTSGATEKKFFGLLSSTTLEGLLFKEEWRTTKNTLFLLL